MAAARMQEDRTGPFGREPHRFAVDADAYRAADHGWLAELDGLSVHAGAPQQRMATRAVDEADWLRIDGLREPELALRRRILAEARPEVSAAVPGSEAACEEAAALVASWLAAHRPEPAGPDLTSGGVTGDGPEHQIGDGPDLMSGGVTGDGPDLMSGDVTGDGPEHQIGLGALERAALSVQEDLCLMERSAGTGGWDLTAGVVLFPSYWRILEKLGHRQEAIHGPVPHYADDLAITVTRFFDRLRPGRIVSRRNWGFVAHPLLFVPQIGVLDTSDRYQPPDLWLRSERQTLRALPDTGAILFTIKVELAPAPALVAYPDLAGRLADAIDGWSPEMLAMRGSRYGGVGSITAWLRSVAAGTWQPAG
ncbi:MAG: DUF3445 domain-containing protein [Acidimicrobiales bacterium]